MTAPEEKASVAIVLPPREAFSPGASGAIGLIARRHATFRGRFSATVFGTRPPLPPFRDARFVAVSPAWMPPWDQLERYARGVARRLCQDPPALIEVHNRPDLALSLARALPRTPVMLILNNDPRGMRRARTPEERCALTDGVARIAVASAFLGSLVVEGVEHPCAPPFVLPNCLDFSAELPAPRSERTPEILFAGRVVADKGADSFVAACALALPDLPDWKAVMLGGDRFGPHNPETPFLRALRPRAAAAGVEMRGYVPHPDILAAMARAAIVVVPSRWREPFGLVAVEAMACGAALLCSNRGGLAEVTGDAAYPIDPDDPAALAEAIRAVARDPALRARLAAAGRARARKFDLAAIGPVLDDLRAETIARFSGTRFSGRAGHPI